MKPASLTLSIILAVAISLIIPSTAFGLSLAPPGPGQALMDFEDLKTGQRYCVNCYYPWYTTHSEQATIEPVRPIFPTVIYTGGRYIFLNTFNNEVIWPATGHLEPGTTGDSLVWPGPVPYPYPPSWVTVVDDGEGTGNELHVDNAVLDILLVDEVENMSLDFEQLGQGVRLSINNEIRTVDLFSQLDGMTIGGVLIHVFDLINLQGHTSDFLTLTGKISQFAIGGQQLTVDNIRFGSSSEVPEPSTLALLGIAMIGAFQRKRRESQ